MVLKVEEEEFIDDYERPVLEKYEKITPTPIEKKKKVYLNLTYLASLIHSFRCYKKHKTSFFLIYQSLSLDK